MSSEIVQAIITPNNADITGVETLHFLVDSLGGFTSGYDITLSQSANNFASPQGRSITSSTRSDNDVININGWLRCVFCDGRRNSDSLTYLSQFKQVIEAQKYTVDAFSTIITNDGFMENMRCVSVNFSRNGDLPEETLITSTWEAANISGDIDNPAFNNAGLII